MRNIIINAIDILNIKNNIDKNDIKQKLRDLDIIISNISEADNYLLEVTMVISNENNYIDEMCSNDIFKIINKSGSCVTINLDMIDNKVSIKRYDKKSCLCIKFYIDIIKTIKEMEDISSDIILNKSKEELEKLGIFILGEYNNMGISIDANNRSLSFRTENNTYIINVSDDNGSIAVIKIRNFDKKCMSYLPGDSICIHIKNKGDE